MKLQTPIATMTIANLGNNKQAFDNARWVYCGIRIARIDRNEDGTYTLGNGPWEVRIKKDMSKWATAHAFEDEHDTVQRLKTVARMTHSVNMLVE